MRASLPDDLAIGPTALLVMFETTVVLEHPRESRKQPSLLTGRVFRVPGNGAEVDFQTVVHVSRRNQEVRVRFALVHECEHLGAAFLQGSKDLVLRAHLIPRDAMP
jgi:hypothetical protein